MPSIRVAEDAGKPNPLTAGAAKRVASPTNGLGNISEYFS
jgi:hypothetical protein